MKPDFEQMRKFLSFICSNGTEEEELKEALVLSELSGESLALPELEEFFELKKKEMDIVSYPFDPPSLNDLGNSGLFIGYEQLTGKPLLWSDLEKSALIMGSIGSGKTNLAIHILKQVQSLGVTAFVFDRRGDYFGLVNEGALFVSSKDLGLNVLEPPPNVDPDTWLGKVAETFCHTYDLLTGSKSLFEELLLSVWHEQDGKANLWDVTARLERRDFLPVRTQKDLEYKGRLYDRLRALRRKAFNMLGSTTLDFVSLANSGKVVIFDMDIEEQLRDFLTLMLLWYIWYFRKYNPDKNTKILFVMDEARYTFRRRGIKHFIADIDNLVTSSRPFGIGYIVLEQIPSQLSEALIANTKLKIAFNSQGLEKSVTGRILGLSRAQESILDKLEVGQCVVTIAGNTTPLLVNIPLVEITAPKDKELEQITQLTLTIYRKLGSYSHVLLKEISQNPFRSISEHIKHTHIPKNAFYETISMLEAKGLIKTVYVNLGIGRPKKLLELTSKGREVLKRLSPEDSLPRFHGGIVHAFWINELKDLLQEKHNVKVCEALPNGKIPDLVVDDQIAIEIETSDNLEYAVDKYQAILQEMPFLIVVVEESNEKNLLKRLSLAIANSSMKQKDKARLKVMKAHKLRAELLSNGFLRW